MLQLDDPIWDTLEGGYRVRYNPSARLKEFENGTADSEEFWEEFWNELHHQGNVGEVSYAVVPQLVRISEARNILDWNIFALTALIEECRLFGKNPPVPTWLESDYHAAIKRLAQFGAQSLAEDWPEELVQSFLAVVAFAKSAPNTGRILGCFSESEMDGVYQKVFS